MGLKTFTKILGVTVIALPLMAGTVAHAKKKNDKQKECAAKAAAMTGFSKDIKKKKNDAKAQKYANEFSKCMRRGSGGGMVKMPKF
jgi:hypothetical protein